MKTFGRRATKKLYFIMALVLALAIGGGTYAYTYTTTLGTIGITEPSGDVATCNETATQPNWNQVLTYLATENKTCGEVPDGNLFAITPATAYSGDLVAHLYMTNTANLTKAYRYFNMKVYLPSSYEADETPNYRMLTLQNGDTSFNMKEITPVSGSWTETSPSDFEDGTLNQVDTTTSPGDVILDTFSDNVTDTLFTKISPPSANITVSGGQVKLKAIPGASDNETLRPNIAGDNTTIDVQYPTTGEHWDKVDDSPNHDDDSTYVETNNAAWQEDLYNLTNHLSGTGVIDYVRVTMVARSLVTPNQASAYVQIKTNGQEYEGTPETLSTTYTAYSANWTTNPQTLSAWTWGEIDNLQAGIGMQRAYTGGPAKNRYSRCTQVYVEVGYTPTTYYLSGTITSIDLLPIEKIVSIDSFDYNASAIPLGTSLKVQFSQNNTNWYSANGTAGGWDTLSPGTDTIDLSALGWSSAPFYYHMLFTSDGNDTPLLDEISVNFSTYYASGDYISSPFYPGYDLPWDWVKIYFTITEPSGTDIVFQIRTATDNISLLSATWYGPTSTTDNYTVSGTDINSVHDGKYWIQYKAYFSGPRDNTPTLSDVTIPYSGQPLDFIIEVTGGGYCLISDNTSEWGSGWTVTPELYCEVTQR